MKTKILVFTTGLAHPLMSRVHYLVRFLVEKQINAKVLDFSFYHGKGSLVGCLKNIITFPSEALRSNETVIHFPSLPAVTNAGTRLTSLMHFLYLMPVLLLSKIITRSIDYDVIVSTDPIAALVAISVAKPNAFVVYEDLDYFADLQPRKIQCVFTSFLEKYGIRRANLVISVSKPLVRRARLLNSNSILIPNGVDLSCFSKLRKSQRELCLVYVGSLVEWAGLKLVVEAFPLLKNKIPRIKMKIAGEGKEKPMLEELVRTLALQDSIFFLGKLPYDTVAALLLSSSVGVAMFKPSKATIFACPLKLFDYMAAGVPIIATDIGDIGRIIKESKSGLAVKWDVDEFAGAAEKLLTTRNLWLECHQNGLSYVKKYDWDNLFDGWLREIQNRVQAGNSFAI